MNGESQNASRSIVLTELLRRRPVSRRDIARATGVSAPTVGRAIDSLLAEEVVREGHEIATAARGRRAVLLDLVAERTHVVGADLGASNTRIVLTDLIGRPAHARELSTDPHPDADHLARWLARSIREVAADAWPSVSRVAVGLPGAVSEDDAISNAPNLRHIEDPRFRRTLAEELARPLLLDNDANYALLGELHFGAATTFSQAAMLTIGTGLGAGLSIDRRILHGHRGLIGEFGQLPIGAMNARLEHMVTGPGILARAREAGVDLRDPVELFEPATTPSRRMLRAQFDQAIVVVLAIAAVSCEPQCIVLGGQVGRRISAYADEYAASLEDLLNLRVTISPAALGNFSGAVGAAVAGLQECYRDLGAQEEHLADLPSPGALTPSLVEQSLS